MEVLPAVEEANSISGQLDKRAKFEIMIVSPQMMGKTSGRSEVQRSDANTIAGKI
jgi:hypothetical protein